MVFKKTDCLESVAVSDLLGGLVRLLGQEDSLDVGEDSTLGDGDSGKQLVQLLVVPDGELEMTGDDPGLDAPCSIWWSRPRTQLTTPTSRLSSCPRSLTRPPSKSLTATDSKQYLPLLKRYQYLIRNIMTKK